MRRNRSFWLLTSLLLLMGLGAAGAGAAGLVKIAGRHPTQAQINAAGDREFAVLWQRLSAGEIFPPSVGYLSTPGAQTTATLVGIAPQAPCGSAVDAKAAAVLKAAGCVAVLRATYTDASHTALATVGVAVMGGAGGAQSVQRALSADHDGLLPVSFPGTVASLFTGKARETAVAQSTAGQYVFLYAAGYADGRATRLSVGSGEESVTTDLGVGVLTSLVKTFQAPDNPCKDKNVRC